ncbi:MAG: tetratricopeptide repeat protein [Isosphaeraceae bacterium]
METIEGRMSAGWERFKAGDLAGAEQIYRQVVQLQPTNAQAWYMLGAVNQLKGRADEAVLHYQEAIRLVPDFPEACNNLGVALHTQKRTEESVAALRRALAIKPDYAEAYNNLGNALHERGELVEAVDCYSQAVRLRPDYIEALNNMGNALRNQGRLSEAMESYDRALEIKPDHAEVHLSRALAWLGAGDFERGLREYEWRFRCSQFTMPPFSQPLWDGSPLDGRTIMLYADHGLGDAIQFIRYVSLVRDRGGRIIVVCARPLARLLATCPGIDQVVVEGEGTADCDVFAPLMSLPRILGTTLATIPAEVPYLFPDASLVQHWRREMDLNDALHVGIAWQGNPHYVRDRSRSFRLDRFEAISRVADIRLISLQKGYGSEQIGELGDRFEVTDLGGRLGDLMDTAAAMENLDLMICVDSALAHLAGALGVPVWVALPFSADWRWLTDRDDSPWYPSMHLFRQRRWGDWDEVFRRITGELETDPDPGPSDEGSGV